MTSNNQITQLLRNCIPIFDLDNTIYSELDFIGPIYLSTLSSFININAYDYFADFKSFYEINGNQNLIDGIKLHKSINKTDFIKKYKINLRGAYSFKNKIKCFEEIKKFITSNEYDHKDMIIVTNGNFAQQKHKIKNLDTNFLSGINLRVIIANAELAKPNPEIFFRDIFQPENNYVYIGDSEVDKEFADNANIAFININFFKHWCNSNFN